MSLITFITTLVCSKICYNFSIFSTKKKKKKKIILKSKKNGFKKKLLYKMLVKYHLSDNIKASFENFVLGLENARADPVHNFSLLNHNQIVNEIV